MSKKLSTKKSLDSVLFLFSTDPETKNQLRNIKNLTLKEKDALYATLRDQQGVTSSENFVVYYFFIQNTLKTLQKLINTVKLIPTDNSGEEQVLNYLQSFIDLETEISVRRHTSNPKMTAWRSVPKNGKDYPGCNQNAGFPMNLSDWFNAKVQPKMDKKSSGQIELLELVFPGNLIITSAQIKSIREYLTTECLKVLNEKCIQEAVAVDAASKAQKSALAVRFGAQEFPKLTTSPVTTSPVAPSSQPEKKTPKKEAKSQIIDSRAKNPFEILGTEIDEKPAEKPVTSGAKTPAKTPAVKAAEKAAKKPSAKPDEKPIVEFEIRSATESEEKTTAPTLPNWAKLFAPKKISPETPAQSSAPKMLSLGVLKQ